MKKVRESSDSDDLSRLPIRKKLVIVGDGGCGKTCLLTVFVEGEFPEVYVPNAFKTCVADIEVSGRLVKLELWDTAGQDDYERLRPLSYQDADAFLICFSISNPVSFLNISEKYHPEVNHFCPRVPVILVGTKGDLRNDNETLLELEKCKQKPVTPEEGQQMAQSIKAHAYLECSAKTGEGVGDVFEMAASASLAKKPRPSTRKCKLL